MNIFSNIGDTQPDQRNPCVKFSNLLMQLAEDSNPQIAGSFVRLKKQRRQGTCLTFQQPKESSKLEQGASEPHSLNILA